MAAACSAESRASGEDRVKRPGTGVARIGTSGWEYPHWRGVFYPERLPRPAWFTHYASHFDTVEANNTFYRLPSEATFDRWRSRAPEPFLYALKMSRFATHFKRLLDAEEPIERFVTRARKLGPHLGPILVHLPPNWAANPGRLDAFLRAAPADLLWAVEFRDRSWLDRPIYEVLRRHRAALCIHDLIPDHPREITSSFLYLRFHGATSGGSYPSERLRGEAERIASDLTSGLDVYAYFNNDAGGHAVRNATALRRFVGDLIEKPGRKRPTAERPSDFRSRRTATASSPRIRRTRR